MMNLLGCSNDDFNKLLLNMNYKKDKDKDNYLFKGDVQKIIKKKIFKPKIKESPFNKLLSLNLK